MLQFVGGGKSVGISSLSRLFPQILSTKTEGRVPKQCCLPIHIGLPESSSYDHWASSTVSFKGRCVPKLPKQLVKGLVIDYIWE